MLLGLRGAAQISRLERGERIPQFSLAIAIELLFNVPASSIFAQVRGEVEEELMTRVYAYRQDLIAEGTARAERKCQLLDSALRRGALSLKRRAV